MKHTTNFNLLTLILIILFAFNCTYTMQKNDHPNTVDLVVFSYNRPLQLYAFLESMQHYIKGIAHTFIIYRTSNATFDSAYESVAKDFPFAHFIKQSSSPVQDFKPLTLDCIFAFESVYIIFAVDDIIIKDYIDLSECAKILEHYEAYGFFLSLGKNLNYCYSMNRPQQLPPFMENQGVYCWQFDQGEYDWNYPHSLDMTLYRKSDLAYLLNMLEYKSPNTLEYALAIHADMSQKGLCFEYSKVLNFPLNMVQHDYDNLHTASYSINTLLNLFMNNLKIDIKPLYNYCNIARHVDKFELISFVPKSKLKKGN